MTIKFDLAPDEFPVFMAETDEQLQSLDEGLVRLEREGEEMELLQVLFRAAHTLKGTSGMIGHKRMVNLTHALETSFDGLRKHTLPVSTNLIDLCLEAVDALASLRSEVVDGQESDVAVDLLVNRFNEISFTAKPGEPESVPSSLGVPAAPAASSTSFPIKDSLYIEAEISPASFASSARAFQIMMLLQTLGEIVEMSPTQEQIETAKPVNCFKAILHGSTSPDLVNKNLLAISEVDRVVVESAEMHPSLHTPAPEFAAGAGEKAGPVKPQVAPLSPDKSAAAGQAKIGGEKTIRTSVERLDKLINLVGELITDRNRLYQLRSTLEPRIRNSEQMDTLAETITHVGRITDQLQMEVMSIRMLPVSYVFNKFPRMVRDLAGRLNKQIDLEMQGENTELDRSVIEVMTDPLIHLIRNSVDHGCESTDERRKAGKSERSRIILNARHEQGRIILSVQDDGQGIDPEKVKNVAVKKGIIAEAEAARLTEDDAINLIFSSGLSTASEVSEVSGRGVGLDIVRANIQRLNGNVVVETWKGAGTRFQVTLPLTLAIVPTLLVQASANIFAIPLVTVVETLRVAPRDILTINSRPVIRLRDKVLPLLDLAAAFDLPGGGRANGNRYVVVVGLGKLQIGLAVDGLMGQEEVVVKSLGALIGEVEGISSAAILGNGQVILIVDVQDLVQSACQSRPVGI